MNEKSLTPVIGKLEKLFSSLNTQFFNGELQRPVITVAPDTTKGAYGWCTGWRAWTDKEPKPFGEMSPEEVEALSISGYRIPVATGSITTKNSRKLLKSTA